MTRGLSNVGASVRRRLLNLARERGDEFQFVLMHFALERFLYRLSLSEHSERLVLKGAMLLEAWLDQPHRATRDADFLAFGPSDGPSMERTLRDIIEIQVPVADGLSYLADTIQVEEVREDRRYTGLRASLTADLDGARVPVLLDFGFGDAVVPAPRMIDFPTLLDLPAPRVRAYAPETSIAEKLDAMVELGIANSRMKDFFDISVLSRSLAVEGPSLRDAIVATFAARRSSVVVEPFALTDEFVQDSDKRRQWSAFIRRTRVARPTLTLAECADDIRRLLGPILVSIVEGKELTVDRWDPNTRRWEEP